VKRSGFARPSLEKIRDYEARQATARRARGMSKQPRTAVRSSKSRRRNDAPWHAQCTAEYGPVCSIPGCGSTRTQMDHLIKRSQGGPSVVENGWPLCDETANGHHVAKDSGRLKIRREWLTERQIDWLRRNGHAEWLPDGTVAGRHCPQFAPAERIAA
jgi:5-methylcytosine-specific restriction endonuclease McrA